MSSWVERLVRFLRLSFMIGTHEGQYETEIPTAEHLERCRLLTPFPGEYLRWDTKLNCFVSLEGQPEHIRLKAQRQVVAKMPDSETEQVPPVSAG